MKSEHPPNLLHQTVMKNYASLFHFLLEHGWDPNRVLTDQKTALSIAVVSNQLDPEQRLTYIRSLLDHGADPLIADGNNVSPFKRLCGMGRWIWRSRIVTVVFPRLESNYPLVYEFFRDYLLSHHRDQVQNQLNEGLTNAIFNGCLPMVTDLLKHGAILSPLLTIASSVEFLRQVSSTVFLERRSISTIDPFLVCLTQLVRYNLPCENWSIFIEHFFDLIYIPGVCSALNNDPPTRPSLENLKKFLSYSFHFGYLTSAKAREIRTNLLPKILNNPIENPSVTPEMRQTLFQTVNQYFDEGHLRYHQHPVSLRLRSIRVIRQSTNHRTIDELGLKVHLKHMIFPNL